MRQAYAGALVAAIVVGMSASPLAGVAAGQPLPSNVNVPEGAVDLGTVSIPRSVMANGQSLSAGDYDVRLTSDSASPDTVGALTVLERWAEFRQGEDVRGREVVTIVPQDEITYVAKSAGPGTGSSRVELLREEEYMRVWINQDGTHYLIHLVVG